MTLTFSHEMDTEKALLDDINSMFGSLDTQNRIWLEKLVITSVSTSLIKHTENLGMDYYI